MPDQMTEAELRAVAHAVYAAAGSGDWETAERYLSDELVIVEADNLPYAGTYTGRGALRELYGIVMAYWAEPELEFHAMTAGDDHVVSMVTFHMTSRRSGKRLSMPLTEVFQIEDGKIVRIQPYYYDTKAMVDFERP